MTARKTMPVVMLLLVTAGFLLRIYRLDVSPLRGDEAFTVQNWMSLPLAESLSRIATIEPHPFLNYVLFRIWGLLAGTSEFSARYLPALVNVLGIAACYGLGRRLLNHRAGLLAALLWACHPYLIWHSQDARNYAIWSGVSVVALWLGLRAVQRNHWLDWALYLVGALLAANVFYFEWFNQTGFFLFVLVVYRKAPSRILRLLLVQAVVVLPSALSFVVLQGQLITTGGYGGTTGTGLNLPRLLTWFLPVLVWGETLPSLYMPVLGVGLLIVFVLAFIWLWRSEQRYLFIFFLLVGFFPLVLLSVSSLRFDIFAPRYVLSVVPVFVLLIAFLVDSLLCYPRFIGVILLGTGLVFTLHSVYNLYWGIDYAKAKNWPALTQYLETRVKPDDLIIQLSVDPAFGYYYDGAARDIGLPANPSQPVSEIHQELETDSRRYRSIWLVGQTFPDWPNYGVVERWLQDNLQLVRDTQLSGMRVQQYMRWAADEVVPAERAVFAGVAELVSAQVWLPPEPTGEITVWLYWRPDRTTETPYKVFVHLTGAINPATGTPLWSQDDRYPQNGRVSTTDWALAAIYRDVYVLPTATVLPGEYEVRVGFYNPVTGERARLANGEDSYRLQTITLP
ncbi:MAG: glycosyltransferase family 39 protein [Chloroflexi bacterium]|nr:glycosyltransferase family 39 protein [Chloroflexota bacterium]